MGWQVEGHSKILQVNTVHFQVTGYIGLWDVDRPPSEDHEIVAGISCLSPSIFSNPTFVVVFVLAINCGDNNFHSTKCSFLL